MVSNVQESYQERILKVLIYIQNHLDDDLSLEKLAEIAHFSPYHFHRIFTGLKGESVQNHVRRLRLERAAKDLCQTDLPLTRISERAGYETQQSFHRAFQRAFNMTPITCKEDYKKKLLKIKHSDEIATITARESTVQLIDFPATEVAFVRQVGNLNNALNSWMKLASEIGVTKIFNTNIKKISIFYDSPDLTPSDKQRYDACITIESLKNIQAKGELGIQTLYGGKYALITHKGDINRIEETYKYLFAVWLPNSGFEPADAPNFMHHRKVPFETKPEELETDIYLPLK